MKKFLLVSAAVVGLFLYAGTDLAKHNKAAATQYAKHYGAKAAASTGAALSDLAPNIKN